MSRFYALGLDGGACREKCLSNKDDCKVICLNIESIPAYSDMSQIVKLRNNCEIVQSELYRWAEPMKYGIARSLSNHLSSALGERYILVPLFESSAAKIYDYKVCVGFSNFIFTEDKSELLLSANISIFEKSRLVAICEYSDRSKVGSVECEKIVQDMDLALKKLGKFIARCLSKDYIDNAVTKPIGGVDTGDDAQRYENKAIPEEKVTQGAENFPIIINISARGEVYVIVDSEDGTQRYFSGRLFEGSSVNVECDAPFKVISTDNSLIEVK
ncbi:MAG: PqiC family protein [Puniceicoccales bacterium]|nr:PqiC family protein [Puniceicoccales bacterium]